MKKEQEQRKDPSIQNTGPPTSICFALCPQCQRRIHPSENVGVVPMSLMDPNGSNRIIQQTIQMMDKNKEI